MKLHDPSNRLSKPVPFADNIGDFTLEGAKEQSWNCERCMGEGFAPIFSPRYSDRTIEIEIDPRSGAKQVLMRTVGFCVCPLGRKIAVVNRAIAKDFFLRTPDLHDVFAGKYHAWVADDPSQRDAPPFDIDALRPEVRRLANAIRLPKIYREPETTHEEINRMFDEEAV